MMGVLMRWMKNRLDGHPIDSAGKADAEDRPSTELYDCPTCERTYISERMESCPNCGTSVDPIPNEGDLGLT
jgi:rubrerythrin